MITISLLVVCLIYLSISAQAAEDALCFSGSTLYQRTVTNCNTDIDKSYNGTWYCSKIRVCELDISSKRQCVTTRGCAYADQCINPSTNQPYNGDALLSTSGQLPAGMTLYPTCCKAVTFPTDDSIAIDYGDICNPASKTTVGYIALSVVAAVAVLIAVY